MTANCGESPAETVLKLQVTQHLLIVKMKETTPQDKVTELPRLTYCQKAQKTHAAMQSQKTHS
jgi:hypothetical protein